VPDQAELREAIEPLRAVASALAHVQWRVSQVANVEADEETTGATPHGPTPTFEEIGRLFSFLVEASGRLDEIRDYVSRIDSNLRGLDYARIVRGGDTWRASDAS